MQGVSGSVVQKGEAVSGDLKLNKAFGDQTVDVELNQDAKAKVTVSFASLIPNGKLAVGGTVQDLETIKVLHRTARHQGGCRQLRRAEGGCERVLRARKRFRRRCHGHREGLVAVVIHRCFAIQAR